MENGSGQGDPQGGTEQIAARVSACRARVLAAMAAYGRQPGDVRVLLATKTQTVPEILAAVNALAGFEAPVLIGENRVQEIVAKAPGLAGSLANHTIELHLIGPLQRNKINAVLAAPVSVVEGVDNLDLALALSERVVRAGRELAVMVQANVSDEATKSGCAPQDALGLASEVAKLPGLALTGFMCLGYPPILLNGDISNTAQITAGYNTLRAIRDAALDAGITTARELSMGMSADLELAIAAGATIVRLGTAAFGPRPTPNPA